MTTISPTTSHLPAAESAPASVTSITDAFLLSWTLARSGFSNTLALPGHPPVTHAAPSPRQHAHFTLHLTRPLPVHTLTAALLRLRHRNAPPALQLLAAAPASARYREHLHLNADAHVLGIRRHFREAARTRNKPKLLALLWKSTPALRTPHAKPWQTLRALKHGGVPLATHMLPAAPILRDPKSHLLSQLPPHSLRALADHLGFTHVRDYIFAHPNTDISSDALLRGPLFIDSGSQIQPDHTHIGPAWITRKSPPVTINTRGANIDLAALGTSRVPHPSPHHAADYFVGPRTRHKPAYEFFKRLFDIAFSLFALAVTLPICIPVALFIKLYDRGPIFFIHTREGRHAKPFGCMKFRTMVRDAEALKKKLREANQVDGPQFKIAHDPRITPIGRFLRKTNIDELPQFINVLKGEMSIVGPRPSPFDENQLCPAWREARLSVTPGITGLWQISRSRDRGAADFQEWIFYDTQYVERRNFLLDLRIVLLTLKELFGKGQ
ncbi:MAG: sugar transferase [Phycisphaerae bacterium]